jgi:hypothetical protein
LGGCGLCGVFGVGLEGFAPFGAEVLPGGVQSDDKADFLDARPSFQLLLAGDGLEDQGVALVVDEFIDVIAGGETAGVFVGFVLADADFEVGGDADVEVLEAAGEDVDVGLLGHGVSSGECRTSKDKGEMRGSLHSR